MLNTAILMGRLTSDPELRYTPNDTAVNQLHPCGRTVLCKIGHRPPSGFHRRSGMAANR